MNKLHPNLVRAVVESVYQIFNENRYADKVIERVLQSNKKWGARDRAFIAESVYEMVRWWRLLLELSDINYKEGQKQISHEAIWKVFGIWWLHTDNQLPGWKEFQEINTSTLQKQYDVVAGITRIEQSVPDWLYELGLQEMGDSWDKELIASNQPAEVVLRTNSLKTDRKTLQQKLAEAGIETQVVSNFPLALTLTKRQNIFKNQLFKDGWFEVQDAGSQAISDMLDVKPEMRVIDACAGAGGKTLHLAALMQNKGRIISMDLEGWKLQELRKRAKRAGANIIETRVIDSSKVIKRLSESADRVLLDVPCSGLGVLRRNPDAKWKLSADFINQVKQTQAEILQSYSRMVKKGGKLVYSTCSLLPSENQQQVKAFLKKQDGNFKLLEEKQLTPAQHGFDGFYMACMERI